MIQAGSRQQTLCGGVFIYQPKSLILKIIPIVVLHRGTLIFQLITNTLNEGI